METVVIVIHVMVVVALIAIVLIQRSEGGALGIGGGGGFMSSRGTANVLTRTTAILAAIFFATSLVLGILAGMNKKSPSTILDSKAAPAAGQPANGPAEAPKGQGSILDQLQQMQQGAKPVEAPKTEAPAAPAPAAPTEAPKADAPAPAAPTEAPKAEAPAAPAPAPADAPKTEAPKAEAPAEQPKPAQ
jgi:preprotein translocase subunit SecG